LSLTLHILVSGLLEPVRLWAKDYREFPRFDELEALLLRAREASTGSVGYEHSLLDLCEIRRSESGDVPTAPLRRFGITGMFDEGALACLDPVCLQVDIGSAYLHDAARIGISRDEADALVRCFNDHFADRGLHLDADLPHAWHLRLGSPDEIAGCPIREARGRDVTQRLPEGRRAAFWHGVMNETQMLFHGLPQNQEREAAGRMPVNGVWLHGAGALPEAGPQATPWSRIWGDDPLVAGIGLWTGVPTGQCPDSLNEMLETTDCGRHLVILDEMSAHADYDEFPAWVNAMRELGRRWFGPLGGERRVKNWVIQDDGGGRFESGRGLRWPWRRVRPLVAYCRGNDGLRP